ncbi:hypothetical protein AGLY_018075 [Aphis glycines]|uniref:BESS domain-containing protein n=1 Tax=Aphis glycines TaxID=307491 RepID=A0A6G0ST84_APHGL|nr:hypothetical protein AGLY_018075 [Aphis glycines]
MKFSGNQAKQRWENLRRCFCNARNRRRGEAKSGSAYKTKTSWKFEQQMAYILPFLEKRKTQGNLNNSNLVAEPEDLSEESEAEDIVPSQVDKERDAQDNQAIDFDSASTFEHLKRVKTQKQNTTPAGQLVEILKESTALRKRQYEENITCKTTSKPTSVLENLDDTDLFFLSMSKMTKQLPKLEQSQIKLALSNSVLSAEIRCNQQSISTTLYPCSIQPQSFVPQQSYASTPSPALSQECSSGEYSNIFADDNRLTVLEMVSLPQSQYQ